MPLTDREAPATGREEALRAGVGRVLLAELPAVRLQHQVVEVHVVAVAPTSTQATSHGLAAEPVRSCRTVRSFTRQVDVAVPGPGGHQAGMGLVRLGRRLGPLRQDAVVQLADLGRAVAVEVRTPGAVRRAVQPRLARRVRREASHAARAVQPADAAAPLRRWRPREGRPETTTRAGPAGPAEERSGHTGPESAPSRGSLKQRTWKAFGRRPAQAGTASTTVLARHSPSR